MRLMNETRPCPDSYSRMADTLAGAGDKISARDIRLCEDSPQKTRFSVPLAAVIRAIGERPEDGPDIRRGLT